MANGLAVEPPNGSENFANRIRRFVTPDSNSASRTLGNLEPLSSSWCHDYENSRQRLTDDAVKEKLLERDAFWREHERSQILFIQEQHKKMLKDLHTEMEVLQNRCRELSAVISGNLDEQHVSTAAEETPKESSKKVEDLQRQLVAVHQDLESLREERQAKENKICLLEYKLEQNEEKYRADLQESSLKIKQISQELNSKAALITQLSYQLHQLRLKEAIEKQKGEQSARVLPGRSGGRPVTLRPSPSAVSVTVQPRRSASLSSEPLANVEEVCIRRRSVRLSTGSSQSWRSGDSSSFLPPIHRVENVPSENVGNIEKPSTSTSIGSFVHSPFRRSKEYQAKRNKTRHQSEQH